MDDMTFRLLIWVLGAGLTVSIAVVGGIIKYMSDDHSKTKTRLDDLRRDHADFRVEVANRYVSHDQLQKLEERLERRFDKLEEILKAVLNGDRNAGS